MTPMNDSERSCAHRPMSCDGPRGPCVACTIVERDELRAEVERLRADAEVRDFREGGLRQAVAVLTADRHCRHLLQQQAESRLAAANALLAKLPVVAVRGIPGLLCNLILEARAHLAAQPATVPSRFDGLPPFDKPATAPSNHSLAELRHIWLTPVGELTPAERVVNDALADFMPTRAEAEQRVLDAMASVPAAALDRVAGLKIDAGPSLAMACQFELARRGLK